MNTPRKLIKISVITVCYNSEASIEYTLQSMVTQSYPNLEYIIIDGGSTDNTLNIISKYQDNIDQIISERDKGIYDALNKGIALASGDLIGILHSDDTFEPNILSKVAQYYKTDVIITGDCYRNLNSKKGIIKNNKPLKVLKHEMAINHPATFIPKAIYNKLGSYDTTYEIAADNKLIASAWKLGIEFDYINSIVTNFSYGGKSDNQRSKSYLENYRVQKELQLNNSFLRIWILSKKILLLPFKRLLLLIISSS